jgi:hypothetical protein
MYTRYNNVLQNHTHKTRVVRGQAPICDFISQSDIYELLYNGTRPAYIAYAYTSKLARNLQRYLDTDGAIKRPTDKET